MNLFRIKQYIKYRLKAQGRHGLHSPFAYAFVEDVLRANGPKTDLADTLISYYDINYWEIKSFHLSEYGGEVNKSESREKKIFKKSPITFDRLFIFPVDKLDDAIPFLATIKADDIVMVSGTHNDATAESTWEKLQSDPRVTLSIDVFYWGLLFFREEFKVKQHFVLR